ncbi:MAG: hypothetical protein QNK37_27760 [Acidobacteriota bacterium]|nr:hypothetical protein [Acidobacteriota bacterium]
MLDLKNMTPGQVLADIPVGDWITSVGQGIAESQSKLDLIGIRLATMLATTKVDFVTEDGETIQKTLLELGFKPNFYHIPKASLSIQMTMSMSAEQGFDFSLDGTIGDASIEKKTENGKQDPNNDNPNENKENEENEGESTTTSGTGLRAVPFGAAVGLDFHRKFEFDASGSSTVTAEIISVPAPAPFMTFLDTLKPVPEEAGT